jgi:anti-anti-sigma factor
MLLRPRCDPEDLMTPKSANVFESNFTTDRGVLVVALRGKLDPVAVEELTPKVEEAYRAGSRRFVFDLTHLDYVGSLGLRLFVGLYTRVKGEGAVVFCNPSGPLRSVLELTKVNHVLRLYPTRAEAIDAALT